MGVSDKFHFSWLNQAIEPVRDEVRSSLPPMPHVIGIGEQGANPFIQKLLANLPFSYQACDLFPTNEETIACDLNDLSPLYEKQKADIVCLFRSSYFIRDKRKFFGELKKVTKSNCWFFTDLLIGSSNIPVLDFRYGDTEAGFAYKDQQAYFETSFYDERLLREFSGEVDAFVRHARNWPVKTKVAYFMKGSRFFLRDVFALRRLTAAQLGEQMRGQLQEKNLISLADFEQAGFEIAVFSAKYFYPEVAKFNLYCFVGARHKNG